MGVAATTTDVSVAATAASLDEALERRKRIDELLKSTGESLARIARLQDSTQRLWDSRPQRLDATEQGVQAVTPASSTTTPLVLAPTTCLTSSMQEKYQLSAQQVFDERSERHKVTTSNVLHVTVTCVLYPVTEKALHLVFDPYGSEKGVLMMVLERKDHVIALVAFPSPHEATRAREALHGRNIYDGCCRMDIKYSATLPASTPTAANPTRCSASASKLVDTNEQLVAARVPADASPVHDFVALAATTTSQTCPVKPEQLGANQVLDRLPSASFDKEKETLVQEELDDVLTNVGGSSLFEEFFMDNTDQAFEVMLLQNELQYDSMLTQTIALHTQCHNQQGKVCTFLVGFGTGVGGKLSDRVMVYDAQQGGRVTAITMRPRDSSAGSFYGMPRKKLKLANSLAELWDPGIVKTISRSVYYVIGQFYGFNQSTSIQLIPKCSNMFLDTNVCSTILLKARLQCKLFRIWNSMHPKLKLFIDSMHSSIWDEGASSPCQLGTVCTQPVLVNLSPWRTSGFSPGYYKKPHLERMPSWMYGGFSPGVFAFIFITESRVLSSHLWIRRCPRGFLAIVNGAFFFITSRMKKLFILVVSPIEMTRKLYLGNNIQTYEGAASMGAVEFQGDNQPSFGVNSKYAVQLHGHLMPSLVDESTAATKSKELFQCVNWQHHIGKRDSLLQEGIVKRNQQKAGSGCYFHIQSSSFVLSIVQLCNMSTPDGLPWDPGGVHGGGISEILPLLGDKQYFAGAVV